MQRHAKAPGSFRSAVQSVEISVGGDDEVDGDLRFHFDGFPVAIVRVVTPLSDGVEHGPSEDSRPPDEPNVLDCSVFAD